MTCFDRSHSVTWKRTNGWIRGDCRESSKVKVVNAEGFAEYEDEIEEGIKAVYMPEAEITNNRMLKKHLKLKKHFKYIKLSESSMKIIIFGSWKFFVQLPMTGHFTFNGTTNKQIHKSVSNRINYSFFSYLGQVFHVKMSGRSGLAFSEKVKAFTMVT